MGRGSARNRGSREIASILTSFPSDNGQALIQNTNYLQLLQKRQSESCHLPFTICSPQKQAVQTAMLPSTSPLCSGWAPSTEARRSLETNLPGFSWGREVRWAGERIERQERGEGGTRGGCSERGFHPAWGDV